MIFKRQFAKSVATLSAGLVLLLVFHLPAFAALGGDVASVQSDAVSMKASVRSTPMQAYMVHEIRGSGTVVREYVSPAGKVFAVAWEGPFRPDLRQVLGTYFQQFQQAVESHSRRVRGPVAIETPGLVVYSSGHMRAFVGKAYIPDMLPQGVAPEAIK
jgi:hypothetical protein